MTEKTEKIAILMLACRDYEAMEVALACHTAYGNPEIPFFILQNCRGNYDAERTLEAARRYETLFPKQVRVIDHIAPGVPYRTISELLASDTFAEFDLICKVDDDAFPITQGWIDALLRCWKTSEQKYGNKLAYVTPLINNNCWGFAETIKALKLEKLYFKEMAREHRAGAGSDISPRCILSASEIATGSHGTIWGAPYLARWLHEVSTLKPDEFIAATRNLSPVQVPSQDRYSIGCILFRRNFWNVIDDGGSDDEHMMQMYCRKNESVIVCERSIPFVHIAYFSQREENRDIVEKVRDLYTKRLNLPFPIGLKQSRLLEIEARLRWLESKSVGGTGPGETNRGNASTENCNCQAANMCLLTRIARSLRYRSRKLFKLVP